MVFAVGYFVVAGLGAWGLTAWLGRSAGSNFWLAYLRGALFFSAGLMLIDIIGFLAFGVWWMPPIGAVMLGFAMPFMMMMVV